MTQSVHKNKFGPDWPLGMIVVGTAGTPVAISSLVDPSGVNAPGAATPGTAGADDYSRNIAQLIIVGVKSNSGTGVTSNTGNVYLMRAGVQGSGNHTDFGAMVAVIAPNATVYFPPTSAAQSRNRIGLYDYYIDADNAADSALVTALIE